MTKGSSVCRRSVIQKDAIEGMLLEQIGENLREFLGAEGRKETLRSLLGDMVATPAEAASAELARLRDNKDDIQRRINGILDNITAENREFADTRIRELKKELREVQPRLAELAAASAAQVDPDELTEAMLTYMEDFQRVVGEGTVEEKRRFIRAFTGKVELDPETGKGRAELLYLPKEEAL